MSTLIENGLRIRALPSGLGTRTIDDAGMPVRPTTDPDGGAALRCCLRNSRPGEQVALVAVVPEGPQGAYSERGPVFVHAHDCGGPADDRVYPEDWRSRTQVLRAYDRDGRIVGGQVAEAGTDHEAAARRLFADPAVAFVQTRNVVFGCYMATLVRLTG